MQLTINNKVYDLTFGIEFLREIDKRYELADNKFKLGMGLVMLLPKLKLGDIVAMFDVIQAATTTQKSKPSRIELEMFLVDEETDLEVLSENFMNAFETQPLLQKAMKTTTKAIQKMQQEEESKQRELMARQVMEKEVSKNQANKHTSD